MNDKICTIYIYYPEILIIFIEKTKQKIINSEIHRILSTSHIQLQTVPQIIEFIARITLSHKAINTSNWKIYIKNISRKNLKKVQIATNIETEKITLARQQEFICNGIINEFKSVKSYVE